AGGPLLRAPRLARRRPRLCPVPRRRVADRDCLVGRTVLADGGGRGPRRVPRLDARRRLDAVLARRGGGDADQGAARPPAGGLRTRRRRVGTPDGPVETARRLTCPRDRALPG